MCVCVCVFCGECGCMCMIDICMTAYQRVITYFMTAISVNVAYLKGN